MLEKYFFNFIALTSGGSWQPSGLCRHCLALQMRFSALSEDLQSGGEEERQDVNGATSAGKQKALSIIGQ